MIKKNINGLNWLEFELFADISKLKHGIFTRRGGVSQGEFSSLNLGFSTGDLDKNVEANLNSVKNAFSLQNLISAKQLHGENICHITPKTASENLYCDILTTKYPEIGLLIKHADCQAAIFYDPICHVLSCAHIGWRGSVQNVYRKTVEDMVLRYESKPENILVGISPSLGPNNSEFIHYQTELPRLFDQFEHKPNHFNFWEISVFQLKECGILSAHIEVAKIDTFENTCDFFSYRKEKRTGRNGTVATLL